MGRLLFSEGDHWTTQQLMDTLDVVSELGERELGYSLFPNRVMVVNPDEMCDAYAHNGMPHYYPHWSHGKEVQDLRRRIHNGEEGLAYELVVPTNPCISWNMSSNSAATMALVLAHAAVGHNFVFKNNALFQTHTRYGELAEYGVYARDLVARCEAASGATEVEKVLDAAHALMLPGGIFRYGEPEPFDLAKERARMAELMRLLERGVNAEFLETVPGEIEKLGKRTIAESRVRLPEENLIYFLETHGPKLSPWQRELLRMVRTYAQQKYLPSVMTKLLNEGCATFTHSYLVRRLQQEGYIDDGTFLEIIRNHTGVVRQPMYADNGRFNRINPYYLGSLMFEEIVRIAGPRKEDHAVFEHWIDTSGPTEEDRAWFPDFAGSGAWREMVRDAASSFVDQTFVSQFLSPMLMRKLKMFAVRDEGPHYLVTDIHDQEGYGEVRHELSRMYTFEALVPRVEVLKVDLNGDRKVRLRYRPRDGMKLDESDAELTRMHFEDLWGFPVELITAS